MRSSLVVVALVACSSSGELDAGVDAGELVDAELVVEAAATDAHTDGAACVAELGDCSSSPCCGALLCSHSADGATCRRPCSSSADCGDGGACEAFFDRPELSACMP